MSRGTETIVGYIALTVRSDAPEAPLSPFFAKAGGLLLVDPSIHARVYLANPGGAKDWACEEILRREVSKVLCGFIGAACLRRFTVAGVDVRLGPCSVPAESLIDTFKSLPKAVGPATGRRKRAR